MAFPYLYAHEKLSNAVRILAIGEGDVRSRLLIAYLEFFPLRIEDIPVSLQKDYQWIINELTKRKPNKESEHREMEIDGSIQYNLRRMTNRTGSRIAEKLCNLQYQITLIDKEWFYASKRKPS